MPVTDFVNLQIMLLDCSSSNSLHNFNPENRRFHYFLNNKLMRGKIMFVELLTQLCLLYKIKRFNFNWFCDFRLRVYFYGSALNPTLPLSRTFLQYYNTFSLSYYEVNLIRQENLKKFSNQIFLNTYSYKFGEAFFYFNTLWDYHSINGKNYAFRSMISYDSTGSGTQMLALSLRSKILARHGSLLKESIDHIDIYTSFSNYNTTFINKLQELLNKRQKNYFTFYKSILDLTQTVLNSQFENIKDDVESRI
jgi:hypothetical protein